MSSKVIVRAAFWQGKDRDTRYHVLDELTTDAVRTMLNTNVSPFHAEELRCALRDSNRGQLGWTDYTVVTLSEVMDFDHVIEVHADGTITEPRVTDKPDAVYDDEPDRTGWTLLSGFTGQHGYNGPVLHASEFVGGGLESHILTHPGQYVSLIAYVTPDEDDIREGEDHPIAGWCVAFRETGD